ncbi:MAG: 2Fe-2S iron-sulfur cluster-binding protein [Bacillus subtilis]|nr:2Fe-2S iron-sulfur cluster-binding protein [Bacillus subtilis]
MSNLVNLIINGKSVSRSPDYTILKAADAIGISVPRLCFLEGIHEEANCRVCVVKIEGQRGLKPSCKTLVAEGMNVTTDTKDIYDSVSTNLELLAANHKFECWRCSRENSCEFLDLLRRFSVDNHFSDEQVFEHKKFRLERFEQSDGHRQFEMRPLRSLRFGMRKANRTRNS